MMKGKREKLKIGDNASLRPGHSLLSSAGAGAGNNGGVGPRKKPKMDAAALLGSRSLLSGAGAAANTSQPNLLSRLDAFLPKLKEANTALEKVTATAEGRSRIQIDEEVGKMVKAAAAAAARGASAVEVEAAVRAAEESDHLDGGASASATASGNSGSICGAINGAKVPHGPMIEMNISLCPVELVEKIEDIEKGARERGKGEGDGARGGGGGGGGRDDSMRDQEADSGRQEEQRKGSARKSHDRKGSKAPLIEEVA